MPQLVILIKIFCLMLLSPLDVLHSSEREETGGGLWAWNERYHPSGRHSIRLYSPVTVFQQILQAAQCPNQKNQIG